MKPFEIIDFPYFSDERGETIPIEFDNDFPFPVKRIYLVTGKNGSIRGEHAHKEEQEVFVAVAGSVTARLHDGDTEAEIVLDRKDKGLLVRTGCWHEFHSFSSGAVLLAISSTHYLPGEENYVRDWGKFLNEKNSKN